jgi:hypothetical protein
MRIANKFDTKRLVIAPWSDRDRDGATGDIGYIGQLVISANPANGTADDRWPDGVSPAGAAKGALDTTEEAVIAGIITGISDRYQTRDATYGLNNITGVLTQAALVARQNGDLSGRSVYPFGDNRPLVQIHELDPWTDVEIPIYNSTYGTAPTVLTETTGSATGLTVTTNACDFTPVANLCTIFCRDGNNAGSMRQTDDTSTTVATTDQAFQNDVAIGDTFIRVPMRMFGLSYIQLDAESLFIDCSATPATNYYLFHVRELHLAEAGKERVIGRFDVLHFMGGTRA